MVLGKKLTKKKKRTLGRPVKTECFCFITLVTGVISLLLERMVVVLVGVNTRRSWLPRGKLQ
jgi:hypothetical protein